MIPRGKGARLRLGTVAMLAAFLLVFFVPFIPAQAAAPPVSCSAPGSTGLEWCTVAFNLPPGSLNHLSLGSYLVYWGATNTYLGGYTPPIISYTYAGGTSTFTSSGAVFFVVLPIIAVSIMLLGFRRLTALSGLSLLGWGLLITFSSIQQHVPVLSVYGYVMTMSSGAAIVALQWGRRIIGYWNMDFEISPEGQ